MASGPVCPSAHKSEDQRMNNVADKPLLPALPAQGRQVGRNGAPSSLTERQLGQVEGLASAGATTEQIRKRLKIMPKRWKALLDDSRGPLVQALQSGRAEDVAQVLSALRKAAVTAKGTLRKSK